MTNKEIIKNQKWSQKQLQELASGVKFHRIIFVIFTLASFFHILLPFVFASMKEISIDFSERVIVDFILRIIVFILFLSTAIGYFKLKQWLKKLVYLTYFIALGVFILEYFTSFNLYYLFFGKRLGPNLIVIILFALGYPYGIMVPFSRKNQAQTQIKYYLSYINENPNDIDGYNNISAAYINLGENQEAINYLKKAIEKNPDYAHAFYNLGLAYKGLNKTEKARKNFQKAKGLLKSKKNCQKIEQEINRHLRDINKNA